MEAVNDIDEIAAFYAARLDEDDATARRNIGAGPGSQNGLGDTEGGGPNWPDYQTFDGDEITAANAYLDRFRPLRMLREVAAGRKLLSEYQHLRERKSSHESHVRAVPHYTPFTRPGWPSDYDLLREGHFLEQALPLVLGLLKEKAAVWSDHPQYKEKWKP